MRGPFSSKGRIRLPLGVTQLLRQIRSPRKNEPGPPAYVDLHHVAWLRRVSLAYALLAIALGGLTLIGWIADPAMLARLSTGGPPMKANTALCVVLAGLAVLAHRRAGPRTPLRLLATAAAAFVVVLGAASLIEYVLALPVGIDRMLAP